MTNDLALRCGEILKWKQTGSLEGKALRDYANSFDATLPYSLRIVMAESFTAKQAMEFVVQQTGATK